MIEMNEPSFDYLHRKNNSYFTSAFQMTKTQKFAIAKQVKIKINRYRKHN